MTDYLATLDLVPPAPSSAQLVTAFETLLTRYTVTICFTDEQFVVTEREGTNVWRFPTFTALCQWATTL